MRSARPIIGLAAFSAAVLIAAAAGLASPLRRLADLPSGQGATNVDVQLVLAVDVSFSMDPDEQALQREGYAYALTSSEFLTALRSGMHGKIAVTYVEWAGSSDQIVLFPWRLIDGPQTAQAFADELLRAPYRRAYRTSISGALNFASPLFDIGEYRGIRRVIDVSGDGTNNQGQLVTLARDEALSKGITINGLPIMLKKPQLGSVDIEDLDIYYEDCVVGGPGSFVIPIRERDRFKEATRTKLILEIAGLGLEPRVIPASADKPRISCTIGERMWQQRWGGGGIDLQ